jgi:hypothetical protein
LSAACLPPCSRSTRSHSRSSTAFQWASIECSETLSRCEKQVETWQRTELMDVTAKVVIYEAFIEGKLEAPKHLARSVHDLYFEPKYEELRPRTIWSLSNAMPHPSRPQVVPDLAHHPAQCVLHPLALPGPQFERNTLEPPAFCVIIQCARQQQN